MRSAEGELDAEMVAIAKAIIAQRTGANGGFPGPSLPDVSQPGPSRRSQKTGR
jgi:hypothetical protein